MHLEAVFRGRKNYAYAHSPVHLPAANIAGQFVDRLLPRGPFDGKSWEKTSGILAQPLQGRVRSIRGIKAYRGGASRGLSPEPGPLRGAAKPGAEVPYPRTPDDGDVATGALLPPESCGPPAHRVVELVQQVEPGSKQGVAPLMRSHH